MRLDVLQGDCRELLKTLPSESVNCCVTSPPYFGLRDYGVNGQIGLEPSLDEYVTNLVGVFREVRRVLRGDGVLFLNLGDSYFGSGRGPTGWNGIGDQSKRPGFSSAADVRRATACDTSDKAPEDSQERDCLCGSLCGACRRAYQIGKSHNGSQHVPTQSPLPFAPIREHKRSERDHLPTSDSLNRADRSAAANLDSEHTSDLVDAQLRASQMSTLGESSQRRREDSRRSDTPLVCLLCVRSLERDAQGSGRNERVCNCGTGQMSSSSAAHIGSGHNGGHVSGSYPHFTTEYLKPKDLCGVPWRVAFALQADGWWLRSDIIWSKPNPMPESVTDRPTKAHEYVFLLAQSERYYYDAAAIADPAVALKNRKGNGKIIEMGEGRILGRATNPHCGLGEHWTPDGTRNARSVWTVTTQPTPDAHFATFPEALVEPCILAGCPIGGTVLDPFAGSGTTGRVALSKGRKAVLIELNPAYCELIDRRCETTYGLPFAEAVSQ